MTSLDRLLNLLRQRAQTDAELAEMLRAAAADLLASLPEPEPAPTTASLGPTDADLALDEAAALSSAEAPSEHPALPSEAEALSQPEAEGDLAADRGGDAPTAPEGFSSEEPTSPEPATAPSAPEPEKESEEEPAVSLDALMRLKAHLEGGGAHGDFRPTSYTEPPRRSSYSSGDAVLLPLAERLRAKARAARWHARGAHPDSLPDLRSHLGQVEGLDTDALIRPVPGATEATWDALAQAYEAAATAAAVLAAFCDADVVLKRGTPFAEAVVMAAQAQSALRAAYWALRGKDAASILPSTSRDDSDQIELFRWLREATVVDRIYVERHMKWEDAADPAVAEQTDRALRGIASGAGISLDTPITTAASRHFSAIRYHADNLCANPDDWDAAHQKKRLLHYVHVAVEAGVPPSDTRFREHLRAIAPLLPDADDDGLSLRVKRVLEALYDALAEEEADAEEADEATPTATPAPHIAEAAALLKGKRMALFGGTPRPEAVQALERALGLAEVEWVRTRVHQSTAPFESVVRRCDVAVQLIRWSSHSFGDLRDYCDAENTHFVRGTRGYNASSIARDVLDQIGEALRSA